MGRTIDQVIASLPRERRNRINANAKRLAADMMEHADSLAAMRKAANLTQAEMGERMGINQNAVSQLEKRNDVYLSTLNKVAVALGCELEVALRAPDGKRVPLPNFRPWQSTDEARDGRRAPRRRSLGDKAAAAEPAKVRRTKGRAE